MSYQKRLALAVEAAVAALVVRGVPIPQTFTDPSADTYTATSAQNKTDLVRACGRIRVIVANSGVVISLDGGTIGHISLPPNCADDIGVPIPAGCDIRVKRYTAGTAITGLIVEVR